MRYQSCNPIAKGMDADYVLVYLASTRFYADNIDQPLYILEGGGDEMKKTWFTQVSGHQVSKYVEDDNVTPTPYFLENSTLGHMIPFSIIKYIDTNTGRAFDEYQNGLLPIYVADLKFNDPNNDPFFLVYASPGFYSTQAGDMNMILIYKINHDYQSNQEIL